MASLFVSLAVPHLHAQGITTGAIGGTITDEQGGAMAGVQVRVRNPKTGVTSATLSRADGREIPLQTVAFSGSELRLKMSGAPGQRAADLPFLVMAPVADRFEGTWDKPGIEHIRLKLVRARK